MKVEGQDKLLRLLNSLMPHHEESGEISVQKAMEVTREVERILGEKDRFILGGKNQSSQGLLRKPGEDPHKYLQRIVKAQWMHKEELERGQDFFKKEEQDPLLRLLLSLETKADEKGEAGKPKTMDVMTGKAKVHEKINQTILPRSYETKTAFLRKSGEDPTRYLHRIFKMLFQEKAHMDPWDGSIKMKEQDPLIKLLLSLRSKPGERLEVSEKRTIALTKEVEKILGQKDQGLFPDVHQRTLAITRKPGEDPLVFLRRMFQELFQEIEGLETGGEQMKIEGQDPLVKLLLTLQGKSGESGEISEEKALAVSKEVERILTGKDEMVLQRGGKTEVEFVRRPGEDPARYLQRVSSEMVKLREEENLGSDDKKAPPQDTAQKMSLQALYHGLWRKEKEHRKEVSDTQKNIESRGPLLFIFAVVLLGLGILLFFA